MSRALLVLHTDKIRQRAIDWIKKAPQETRVTFQGPRRSLDQNSMLWSLLSQVAAQVPWHGQRLSTEDWKIIFLDALRHELRVVPNLEGTGFVSLGRSSSDLSKEEMADLLTLIESWGASHGVVFHDPQQEAAA